MQRCEAPDCGVEFEPKRSTARYCSATCRQRAARARKAAAAAQEPIVEEPTDGPEHGLVRAVRLELAKAAALETVAGQLALQLARRIANPEEPGLSTLSKELRSLLAEAKAGNPTEPAAAGEPDPEDDEVTRARTRREEARKKAGLP